MEEENKKDIIIFFEIVKKGNLKKVKQSVLEGVDINKVSQYNGGETPLHIAAQNGHLSIVEFLIKSGADINKSRNCGKTPDLIRNSTID